jgi:hypothetical protein
VPNDNLIKLYNQAAEQAHNQVAGHAPDVVGIVNELADPEGFLHVHIPPGGHKIDGEWMMPKSIDGVKAYAEKTGAINLRRTVDHVRQIGDDLLVLEITMSATLPDGRDVSFPNVMMWTFKNGRVVRQIQVASKELWVTLRDALTAASVPGYAPGTEYWKDEALTAARHPADKILTTE